MDTVAAPAVALTALAKGKLEEYLGQEPSGTVVRILVEDDGRFGLSLDTRAADDLGFEVEGLPVVVEQTYAGAIEGLKIDYLEQGASSGFALTGGSQGARPTVLRVEATPNPDAMKLVLSFSQGRQSRTWTPDARADAPPPVVELFEQVPGVVSVFALDNFVTLNRAPGADWDAILEPAKAILSRLEAPATTSSEGPRSDAFEDRLEWFIRSEVAPFLQADGGDIELLGYAEKKVKVRLVGSCGTCPSSVMTLKFGVERRLKEKFPGEVEALELAEAGGGHHGHDHHGHHH